MVRTTVQVCKTSPSYDPEVAVEIRAPRRSSASQQDEMGCTYRNPVLHGLAKTADVCALTLVFTVALWLQTPVLTLVQERALATASLVCIIVFAFAPKQNRLLDVPAALLPRNNFRYLLLPSLACGAAGFAVLFVLGWAVEAIFRAWGVWWIQAIGAVAALRWAGTGVLGMARRKGQLARKIAIIGGGLEAFQFASRFQNSKSSGFQLVGVFDDGSRRLGEMPVQGSIADLIAESQERRIDTIIIALPRVEEHETQVARLVWRLRSVLANVYIMPQLVHGADATMPVEAVGPVSLMVVKRRPLNEWQMFGKSVFDLTAGFILLVLLLPVLLLVAALIKLESPGPVLFRQPRLGFNNCHFTVFKFRSMYTNMTDTMAARQTARDDPRVTRVGKWIRKLSIDELPQLLNVIRGEMSLVGPRPHAPHTRAAGELLHDALAEYAIRHQVKPGITGWAQVNGSRGELVTFEDLRRRVELDLDYIQRWSMWLDLKIMFLTVSREIVSHHAF